MKKFISGIFAVVLALGFTQCKTPTKIDTTHATRQFAVECMGTDMDGSETVRAWGQGKNKSQAMETAKKNAVRTIIFSGVRGGMQGCDLRPIIGGANAQEKNQMYFNRFFADGGAYRDYVSMEDEKRTSRIKSSNKSIENWSIVVRVDRAGLRQRLIDDGIMQP